MRRFSIYGRLAAVAVAAVLGTGAAQAQSADKVETCGFMAKNGGLIMTLRQMGRPKDFVEDLIGNSTSGKAKEFATWMVESAYGMDRQTDPSLVAYATSQFQGMVYDQCMSENW